MVSKQQVFVVIIVLAIGVAWAWYLAESNLKHDPVKAADPPPAVSKVEEQHLDPLPVVPQVAPPVAPPAAPQVTERRDVQERRDAQTAPRMLSEDDKRWMRNVIASALKQCVGDVIEMEQGPDRITSSPDGSFLFTEAGSYCVTASVTVPTVEQLLRKLYGPHADFATPEERAGALAIREQMLANAAPRKIKHDYALKVRITEDRKAILEFLSVDGVTSYKDAHTAPNVERNKR
jgi:hypothetical protein